MIVKTMQQRSNVYCRMCEQEIATIVNEEFPWPINGIERSKAYAIREKELKEELKSTCYGLQGRSAGGYSLEAICARHLLELRNQIIDFLRDPSRRES